MKKLLLNHSINYNNLLCITATLFLFLSSHLLIAQSSTDKGSYVMYNITDASSVGIQSLTVDGKTCVKIKIEGISDDQYYAFERSVDGKTYDKVGKVSCTGTEGSIELIYYFTDNNEEESQSFYRITNIDKSSESLICATLCLNSK